MGMQSCHISHIRTTSIFIMLRVGSSNSALLCFRQLKSSACIYPTFANACENTSACVRVRVNCYKREYVSTTKIAPSKCPPVTAAQSMLSFYLLGLNTCLALRPLGVFYHIM